MPSNACKSNTGYRFITRSKTSYKITIPKPEGGFYYRSLGFQRIGESEGLQLAISERNRMGSILWRKFWSSVLTDATLLSSLPRNLEPYQRNATDRKSLTLEYIARWKKEVDGKKIIVSRRYSCDKHGKLAAYALAKAALIEAYKDKMELLKFMGRNSTVSLK